MRTAICLIALVMAKSSSNGGLSNDVATFAGIVTTVCIVMDIVDFVLSIYHKEQK